jgi:hypothetical protein
MQQYISRIKNTESRRDKGIGETGQQETRIAGGGLSGQQGIRLCGYEVT